MGEELLELFRQVDEPRWLEAPPVCDRAKVARRVRSFLAELNGHSAEPATLETGPENQDASFHSQIELPGVRLRFSSFGDMIAFTPDHAVSEDIVNLVQGLAPTHDYRLIPTEVLERPYTGHQPGGAGIAT